jgi:hypothetical protein
MTTHYAANDIEAVATDLEALSTMDFDADVPDMQMPMLLMAGEREHDLEGLPEAADRLPDGRLVILPDLDPGHRSLVAPIIPRMPLPALPLIDNGQSPVASGGHII